MSTDIILSLNAETKHRSKNEHRLVNTIECKEYNLKPP